MAEDRGKWGSERRSPAHRLVVRRLNIRLIQPIPTNFRIGPTLVGKSTGFAGSDEAIRPCSPDLQKSGAGVKPRRYFCRYMTTRPARMIPQATKSP